MRRSRPLSPAEERKREIWRHNSFLGHTSMTRKHMHTIINSRTATPKAKEVASQIATLTHVLYEALKEREE